MRRPVLVLCLSMVLIAVPVGPAGAQEQQAPPPTTTQPDSPPPTSTQPNSPPPSSPKAKKKKRCKNKRTGKVVKRTKCRKSERVVRKS